MRWPALFLACALVTSCSSSTDPWDFGRSDCHGQLVEVARLTGVAPVVNSVGISNSLAIDGDSLFVAYSATYVGATPASGLPASGGIAAIPLSGGAPRVIAATDPTQTSYWNTGSIWAAGGRIYALDGSTLLSLPADPATASTLPFDHADEPEAAAYAHDAAFAYSATSAATGRDSMLPGMTVQKIPLDGSAPTVLVDETTGAFRLGGMADAGDALLLNLEVSPDAMSDPTFYGVWRIPKDGSPRSVVRPDIAWGAASAQWVAWDGQDMVGSIWVQDHTSMRLLEARVALDGTSPPVITKFDGTVATTRGDEILSLQNLDSRIPVTGWDDGLLVASSKGAPAGTVVACGADNRVYRPMAAGIAANDTDIYVVYLANQDTVIARAIP